MKLYYFPVAPNPTKVRTYIAEKGIEIDSQLVNLPQGEQRKPEFLAKNPLGKLPVLELDDGSVLTESQAIIQYLEEVFPEPNLIGETPVERARVRELERICDAGVLIPMARYVHATNSPLGLEPQPQVAEGAWAALEDNLAILDARVGPGPFVAGAVLTIADCTLWGGLDFGRFREVEIPERFGKVLAWRDRFAQRPSTKL